MLKTTRFTPYFDNGTSLGHEIFPNKFSKLRENEDMLDAYIRRGRHQMKWAITSEKRLPLMQGVIDYAKEYPQVIPVLINSLMWSEADLEEILTQLVLFELKSPLSRDRAEFRTFFNLA